MTDEQLEHLCRLSVCAVEIVRSDEFIEDLRDGMRRADAQNTANCMRIMADAFVELMSRQGIKPRFRVGQTVEPTT